MNWTQTTQWFLHGLRHPITWVALLLFGLLFYLSTPVISSSFPAGLGHSCQFSRDAEFSYHVPPCVSGNAYLVLNGTGILAFQPLTPGSPVQPLTGRKLNVLVPASVSGNYGYSVHLAPGGHFRATLIGSRSALHVILYLFTCALILFLMRHQIRENRLFWILAAAVLLRFFYAVLAPGVANYPDLNSHCAYAELIAQNGIPAPNACFECYHPPTYYVPLALLYRLAFWIGLRPDSLMSLSSLILSCGFLFVGASIIHRALNGSQEQMLGVSLFAFWPFGILGAAAVNNDVPVNFFGICSMFFLQRWFPERNRNYLWLALGCAALATCCKSNGILYFGIIGLGLLWAFWKAGAAARLLLSDFLRVFLAFLATAAAVYGISVSRSLLAGKLHDPLVGNIHYQYLQAKVLTNHWQDYLLPWGSFWDKFSYSFISLKSEIYANMLFENILRGFLPIIAVAVLYAIIRDRKKNIFSGACIAFFLTAVFLFRWRYPFVASAHVRYIAGILVPICILSSRSLEYLLPPLRKLLKFSLFCFIGTSVYLFIQYAMEWL